MSTTARRVAVPTAAFLLLLALGLPWSASSREYVPGWYAPGSCTTNLFDGTMWCTGGYVSPGMYVGAAAQSGSQAVARVFLVGALILIVLAWRHQRTTWLALAGAAVLLGVPLTGLAAQSGQVAALGAAALLLYAGQSRRGNVPRARREPGTVGG